MATDADFAEFIVEQLTGLEAVSARKMFGEYALYCDGKVVALICNNQLFVKPTASGQSFAGDIAQAPPYPGAKLYLLVEDQLDDRDWLRELIAITARELPLPKIKKPTQPRTKSRRPR